MYNSTGEVNMIKVLSLSLVTQFVVFQCIRFAEREMVITSERGRPLCNR